MLLITPSTHATVGAELSADEVLKARRATAQCPRLSDPLVSVTGCGELSQLCRSSAILGTGSVFPAAVPAAELKKETREIYPQWSPAVICVLTERTEGGNITKTEGSGQMSL